MLCCLTAVLGQYKTLVSEQGVETVNLNRQQYEKLAAEPRGEPSGGTAEAAPGAAHSQPCYAFVQASLRDALL